MYNINLTSTEIEGIFEQHLLLKYLLTYNPLPWGQIGFGCCTSAECGFLSGGC